MYVFEVSPGILDVFERLQAETIKINFLKDKHKHRP